MTYLNDVIKCDKCGDFYSRYDDYGCDNCNTKKRLENIICPSCKNDYIIESDIKDGAGWSIFNYLYCYDCGTIFHNMKEKLQGEERDIWIRNNKIKNIINE